MEKVWKDEEQKRREKIMTEKHKNHRRKMK
jgi:hypothetical protein